MPSYAERSPSDERQAPMSAIEALRMAREPFLTDGGHVWLHDACHAPWYAARRAEAAGAHGDGHSYRSVLSTGSATSSLERRTT